MAGALAAALLLPSATGTGPGTSSAATTTAAGPPSVSAVGTALIPATAGTGGNAWVVNAELQSTGSRIPALVESVQATLRRLQTSLVRAGIPAAAMGLQNLDITPLGAGAAGVPASSGRSSSTASAGPQYAVSAYVQIDVPQLREVAAAATAASQAGATSITTYTRDLSPAAQPPAQAVARAVAQAMAEAATTARAAAAAGGFALGPLLTIRVGAPTPQCCFGPGPRESAWVLQVTATYALQRQSSASRG